MKISNFKAGLDPTNSPRYHLGATLGDLTGEVTYKGDSNRTLLGRALNVWNKLARE